MILSPGAHLSCDSFTDLPCFWWPWQFSSILVRYFVDGTSTEACQWLSYTFTGVMCLGRRNTDIKHCHYHIMPRLCAINMTFHCWYWLWLPGRGNVVGFPHFKITQIFVVVEIIQRNLTKVNSSWVLRNWTLSGSYWYFLFGTIGSPIPSTLSVFFILSLSLIFTSWWEIPDAQ